MEVLYITYIDFSESAESGSSIRPQKMYEAFLNCGIQVKLLEGQQNKRRERAVKVKEIINWLENNTPDICYVESPSGPIFNKIDLTLIKLIHDKNIPIGYFYRDAFWLFKDKMKNLSFIKRNIIILMNKICLKIIKSNVDIVYFPSKSVINLFRFANFNEIKLLPPAADISNFNQQSEYMYNCIYVGAASAVDGTIDMIEAFKIVNDAMEKKINLIIVTRKPEWEKIYKSIYDSYEWLKIQHTSKKGLIDLYNRSDVAIIPRKKNYYIDISMPVKLFEYIGFGKPIISTPRLETAEFIRKEKCGIICKDSVDGLAAAIIEFYSNKKLKNDLYEYVEISAKENRWENRVQTVISDLIEIKNNEYYIKHKK